MKVLVTGAFGNIGSMLLDELIPRGYEITAFDLNNAANKKVHQRYKKKINTVWGNICNKDSIKPHIKGQDAIVHFAAIIPPMTETHSDIAEQVNVDGTRNLLDAINESESNPIVLYTSSFAVWGHNQDSPPPRTVGEKDFGENSFYSDWMDTAESQRILEFQNNSFNVLRDDLFDSLKLVRPFVKPISKVASWGFVKWARSS